jgi:hypothetical protein
MIIDTADTSLIDGNATHTNNANNGFEWITNNGTNYYIISHQ